MRDFDTNIQRTDELIELVIRRNGPALRAAFAGGAGEDVAGTVRVAQTLRDVIADVPSLGAKSRARTRLIDTLDAMDRSAWWRRALQPARARMAVTVLAAVVIGLVTSQSSFPPTGAEADTSIRPAVSAWGLTPAEEQAELSRIFMMVGDGVSAADSIERLTEDLNHASQSIAAADSAPEAQEGFVELTSSAEKVLTKLEQIAATSPETAHASSVVGAASEAYADAIESLRISPPLTNDTPRGGISLDLSPLLNRTGSSRIHEVAVSAFRVDQNGGRWLTVGTAKTSSYGHSNSLILASSLPTGTYTRLKLEATAKDGTRLKGLVARPFTIEANATESLAPTAIEWEATPDRNNGKRQDEDKGRGPSANAIFPSASVSAASPRGRGSDSRQSATSNASYSVSGGQGQDTSSSNGQGQGSGQTNGQPGGDNGPAPATAAGGNQDEGKQNNDDDKPRTQDGPDEAGPPGRSEGKDNAGGQSDKPEDPGNDRSPNQSNSEAGGGPPDTSGGSDRGQPAGNAKPTGEDAEAKDDEDKPGNGNWNDKEKDNGNAGKDKDGPPGQDPGKPGNGKGSPNKDKPGSAGRNSGGPGSAADERNGRRLLLWVLLKNRS